MITIGITGIIGSGKSTAAAFLKKAGIPVIDLDELAKKAIMLPEIKESIKISFGESFLHKGEVVISKIREAVFKNSDKLARLEDILYPEIRSELWKKVSEYKSKGAGTVVIDAPLLFEKGLYKELDRTVVVSADLDLIRIRLIKRGLLKDDIERRILLQIPLHEKEPLADFIVHNNGTEKDLEINLEGLLRSIKEWEVSAHAP